jgi:transcriptional regulator with XRE-family HTH domain
MEFHEKLQNLRKQKGLTQEELATSLYVSRTAISKWESGRGYPNIDSLKAIAKFFSVTIDELLSGEEVLTIAEEDHKQKQQQLFDFVFGLLDCSVAIFLFLPFFGQVLDGMITAVSLLSLAEISPYLRTAYFIAVGGAVLLGILTLIFQNCHHLLWEKWRHKFSSLWNAGSVLLFIMGSQPYPAALLFLFLAIKVFLLFKKQ